MKNKIPKQNQEQIKTCLICGTELCDRFEEISQLCSSHIIGEGE